MMEHTQSTQSDTSKYAVAYLRVSTQLQKDKGNSIEQQKQHCEEYAKKNDLQIIEFVKEAKSASKVLKSDSNLTIDLVDSLKSRPGLQGIIKKAGSKAFSHIIVHSRDRLSRNLEISMALDNYFGKKGIKLHYSKPGETISSEDEGMKRFLEMVMANVAELEANLISIRVRDGKEQVVKKGLWPGGHTPYGYDVKPINGKNIVIEKRLLPSADVQRVFELYNMGFSIRKIVGIMNQEHKRAVVISLNDDSYNLWTKSKIEAILYNETYTGKIVWGKHSYMKYQAQNDEPIKSPYSQSLEIISQKDWEVSEAIRLTKSKRKDPKYFSTPFLFRDKLVCGHCGRLFSSRNYGKSGSFYICGSKNSTQNCKLRIEKDSLEKQILELITNSFSDIDTNELISLYTDRQTSILKEFETLICALTQEISSKDVQILTAYEEIKNNDSNGEISDLLQFEIECLKKEREILDGYQNELIQKKEKLNSSESLLVKPKDLESRIHLFFKEDFTALPIERKRYLIDLLIDKIELSRKSSHVINGKKPLSPSEVDIDFYINIISS